MAYLGYRAVLAHPLKRLRQVGSGRDRFLANYAPEGLVPTQLEDQRIGEEASACIACGLCETACELTPALPAIRALGLHAAFRLYSRNAAELPLAREALESCAGCAGCDGLCPTGVPIARVLAHLRVRAAIAAHARGGASARLPPA